MTTALVLVDIQNDYFPGGSMELSGMDAAADQAARLLERFRADDAPRIHVQHLSTRPGATFFLPGTPGAEHEQRVAPRDGEPVITKHFPNAFRDTGLLDALRSGGVTDLLIAGAMSHMCIDATTRAAFDLGFGCTVASDACATRDLSFAGETIPAAQVHAAFMAALAVPYARVAPVDELL